MKARYWPCFSVKGGSAEAIRQTIDLLNDLSGHLDREEAPMNIRYHVELT